MTPFRGKIVTFYSYKGGTGRSMALANVAWVLASTGARVLVVDWDLEAPGLHRYFRPFLSDKELVRDDSEGLIDFMVDFARRMATPEPSGSRRDDKWYEEHADISKWSKRLLWPSGADAQTRLGGTIDFVPAGRQCSEYAKRVNSFDWAGFYERYKGGAFIDAMRRNMTSYDWVLIDSRTGVSDTSGICTVQLPDTLVVCFTLNYQSIEGASGVAASAKEARKKDLRVLPLPTRLDGNDTRSLNAMLAYARRVFDPLMEPQIDGDAYWKSMGVPYFLRYAYSEKLAPFEEQVSDAVSTLPAMERLTSYITEGKVSKLEPLPEPHRADALAEFEQLPDVDVDVVPPAKPAEADRVPLTVKRGWYWAQQNVGAIAGVAFGALVLAYSAWNQTRSAAPERVIRKLVADARKELDAGRRGHAALLIAEASARLDPASVVGPDGDPAKQVYEALFALQPLIIEKEPKQTVRISPDGKWLAATGPNLATALFRFPPQAKESGTPVGYSTAAFSPDSRYLATGGRSASLVVVEPGSNRRVWRWENSDPQAAWIVAAAFSPNGNSLAAATDTGALIFAKVDPWKASVGRTQLKAVRSLTFSPESAAALVLQRDGTLWETATGLKGEPVLTYPPSHAQAVAFAPDGSAIRIDGGTYMIFDGTRIRSKGAFSSADVAALEFSPDGRLLASGDSQGTVNIWQTLSSFSGQEVAFRSLQKIAFKGAVGSIAFSPDSKYIAVGGSSAYVVLLQLEGQQSTFPAAQVRGFACSQADESQLSSDEWKNYFGAEPLRYTCGPGNQHAAR